MYIFKQFWLFHVLSPDDQAGAIDLTDDADTAPVIDDSHAPPLNDVDDNDDDIMSMVSDIVDKSDDTPLSDDADYVDDDSQSAKDESEAEELDEENEDQEGAAEDAEDDANPGHEWPEHMADWTDEQRDAFEALPEDAQQYLANPGQLVENIRSDFRKQYEPLMQQLQPLMDTISNPQTANYLARRQHELGVSQDKVIARALYADSVLAHGASTQDRHQFAHQLLEAYGINPIEMVLSMHGGNGEDPPPDYRTHDMQQQIANERWAREQAERQAAQYQQQQLTQNVEAFARETDQNGQPLRPLMTNNAVRASMAQFLRSGQARNLDEAYHYAAQPLMHEIQQRSEALARQQAKQANDKRQASVRRSARAAPVRSRTAAKGGQTQETGDLRDIVASIINA